MIKKEEKNNNKHTILKEKKVKIFMVTFLSTIMKSQPQNHNFPKKIYQFPPLNNEIDITLASFLNISIHIK